MHAPHWTESPDTTPSHTLSSLQRVSLNLLQILYEYVPGGLFVDVARKETLITKLAIKNKSLGYRSRLINGTTTILREYEVFFSENWQTIKEQTQAALMDMLVRGQLPQAETIELYYTLTLMVSGSLTRLLVRATDIGKEYLRVRALKDQDNLQ